LRQGCRIFGGRCPGLSHRVTGRVGIRSEGVACGEAAATRCTLCRTYFGGSLKRSPPQERGRSSFPPRTAARVMPASRAEDGTASRHAPCFVAVRAPLCPQASLRHIVPLAFVPHTRHERRRLACPRLTRRCRANLRGLRLSRHQLSPPEEDAVAIRFPSPKGSGGLGNELLFFVVLRETAPPESRPIPSRLPGLQEGFPPHPYFRSYSLNRE
jgi:hypothetical protein